MIATAPTRAGISKLPPRRPGYYMFDGRRHIRDALYEHINEPLKVMEYTKGNKTELAVAMMGRTSKFPLTNFDGDWMELETREQP